MTVQFNFVNYWSALEGKSETVFFNHTLHTNYLSEYKVLCYDLIKLTILVLTDGLAK